MLGDPEADEEPLVNGIIVKLVTRAAGMLYSLPLAWAPASPCKGTTPEAVAAICRGEIGLSLSVVFHRGLRACLFQLWIVAFSFYNPKLKQTDSFWL